MRKKDEKYMYETDAAHTLAIFLMNVLVLAIIGAFGWAAYTLLAENNTLNMITRGSFLF